MPPIRQVAAFISTPLYPAIRPAEQDNPQALEQEIGDPNDEMWVEAGPSFEGLGEDEKTVVCQHDQQGDSEPYTGFAAMGSDPQWDSHQGKAHTRE